MKKILEIKNLTVGFRLENEDIKVLDDISLNINQNEIIGIAGESGSGKSVLALSILQLLSPNGFVEKGSILFEDRDILSLEEKELQKIRGQKIGMIFQDPASSLSPLLKVRKQIEEALLFHKVKKVEKTKKTKDIKLDSIISCLESLNLKDVEQKLNSYPHQLSGGIKQRIVIATALLQNPKIIIADEPTTALDVTTQAQILDIFKNMKHTYKRVDTKFDDYPQQIRNNMIFISHDLGVIKKVCDRVVILYASNIVEEGSVDDVFSSPKHPYTEGFLKASPSLNVKKERLETIDGQILSPFEYGDFCHFYKRCPFVFEKCKREKPILKEIKNGRKVACFKF